jgi:hypothetical protein
MRHDCDRLLPGRPSAARRRAAAAHAAGLLLAALTLAEPALARADASSVDAVRACRAERDDARRLACFDAAAARLDQGPATAGRTPGGAAPATTAGGDVRAAAAPATAATAMTPEQRFGYRGEVAREALDQERAALPELERLTTTVQSAGRQATGDFVVTLANGQVWAQLPMGTPQRLKAGDEVTITPASLGSYMLKGPTGRGVRVKRVR